MGSEWRGVSTDQQWILREEKEWEKEEILSNSKEKKRDDHTGGVPLSLRETQRKWNRKRKTKTKNKRTGKEMKTKRRKRVFISSSPFTEREREASLCSVFNPVDGSPEEFLHKWNHL